MKLNKWNLTLLLLHIASGSMMLWFVITMIKAIFTSLQFTWYGVFVFVASAIVFIQTTEILIEEVERKN